MRGTGRTVRLLPSHNLRVEFRLSGVLGGFGLHPDGPDHIALGVQGRRGISVQLWTDRTTGSPRMRYRANAIFDPPAGVRRMFESLAAGRYPHGSQPQMTLGSGAIATSGRPVVRLAAMSLMPQPFREFVDDLGGDLNHAVTRAVMVLRSRIGEVDGPLSPLGTRFEWSLGDGRWHALPADAYAQRLVTGRATKRPRGRRRRRPPSPVSLGPGSVLACRGANSTPPQRALATP